MSRVVRKVRGRKRYTESLLLLPEDKDKRSWFSEGEMSAAASWSRVCPPEVVSEPDPRKIEKEGLAHRPG